MTDKPYITKQDVERDYQQLTTQVTSAQDKECLKRLKEGAKDGLSIKGWIRRIFFGFQLSEAIERWLNEFNPSLNKPLGDQIPKKETEDVVAAWMKYSIRRGVIIALVSLLLSSFVASITAYFLYKQLGNQEESINVQLALVDKQSESIGTQNALIKKQNESVEQQKKAIAQQQKISNHNRRLSYLEILYDEKCTSLPKKELKQFSTLDTICVPRHNSKMRSIAVKGLVELEVLEKTGGQLTELQKLEGTYPDLSGAHLEGTSLVVFDFRSANLSGANLSDANLSRSDLRNAIFHKTILSGTNLTGARLEKAHFSSAIFQKQVKFNSASLIKTDFRFNKITNADFRNAFLSGVSFENTSLYSADFRGSNIMSADFSRATLNDADFTGVELSKVNFYKADIRHVNGIDCDQLRKAQNWKTSIRGPDLSCEPQKHG